jgi:hypothetical protein
MASSPPLGLLLTGALLALAGCGRTEAVPASLADLEARTLQFSLTDVDSLERPSAPGSHRFTLAFSSSERCVRLVEGVSATFNGQPMRLEPGGVPDTGVGGREVCEPPRALFDFDPAQWEAGPTEDGDVLLEDGNHRVRLVVRNAKARRHFSRQEGAPGTLRRGQTHTFLWVPESDSLLDSTEASLIPRDGGTPAALPVEQQGTSVRVLVPAGTVEGTWLLRLSGTAAGEVLTCEGVAGCQGALFRSEDFEVSVVP